MLKPNWHNTISYPQYIFTWSHHLLHKILCQRLDTCWPTTCFIYNLLHTLSNHYLQMFIHVTTLLLTRPKSPTLSQVPNHQLINFHSRTHSSLTCSSNMSLVHWSSFHFGISFSVMMPSCYYDHINFSYYLTSSLITPLFSTWI